MLERESIFTFVFSSPFELTSFGIKEKTAGIANATTIATLNIDSLQEPKAMANTCDNVAIKAELRVIDDVYNPIKGPVFSGNPPLIKEGIVTFNNPVVAPIRHVPINIPHTPILLRSIIPTNRTDK